MAGLLLLALYLGLGACATPPPMADKVAFDEYQATNDPFEPANRVVFAFNKGLDDSVFKPVARAYRDGVPVWVRTRISDALDNLRAPLILLSDILQGELDRALTTLTRFVVNSSVGVLGLNDVASEIGLKQHDEDFGQTLAVWGASDGPYIMLPVFGPSNPRDAIGRAVDFLADPFNRWADNTDRRQLTYARAGTSALNQRANALDLPDDLEKTSLDLYVAVRSFYRQRRADAIRNGAPAPKGIESGAADFPNWLDGETTKEISGKP